MSTIELHLLGWTEDLAGHLATMGDPSLRPARVTRVDRGACDVLGADGPARAVFSASIKTASLHNPETAPCVGDWVAVVLDGDGVATLLHVLPRRTAFVRAAVAPGTSHVHVLAANVEVAAVVEPLLPEPDLGRIERLLALAWESGAQPVVLLTKADLVRDAEDIRADVELAAPGASVHAISAVSPDDVERVRSMLPAGRTMVLLGPSGAGKSTLTNALAGADVMATQALRADGKGRHTTAYRELLALPGGGLVIDTPGLRSIGLTSLDEGLDRVFPDVDGLAAACRFLDCAHEAEPGCAVLAAVDSGELPERRLLSWRKLQREARWMAMRHDARLRAEERAKWKRIYAEVRRSGRMRP